MRTIDTRMWAVLTALLLPYLVVECQQDNNTPTSDGCYCFEPFGEDFPLRNPVVFREIPDGSGRVMVTEQLGIVYVYDKTGSQRNSVPFLDLTDIVPRSSAPSDERGLLGLAFHPQFFTDNRLFVFYTFEDSSFQKVRISEFRTDLRDRDQVDRSTERILLEIDKPFTNHNGGEVGRKVGRSFHK